MKRLFAMSRRVSSFIVAGAFAIPLLTILAACTESSNVDTFIGKMSDESYTSQESAAEAFLENEISGDAVHAELNGLREIGMLSTEELAALEMGDAFEKDDEIISTKVVEVTYTREIIDYASKDFASSLDTEDSFIFTIYIIKTSSASANDRYFYYVPKAQVGDALTRSYYEDVFDPAKYLNYTLSSEENHAYTGFAPHQKNYLVKRAMDKANVDITEQYEERDEAVRGYFEEGEVASVWLSNDMEESYIKDEENYFAKYGITNIGSLAKFCLPNLDHSYFEKTRDGFKIQEVFLPKIIWMELNPGGALLPLEYIVKTEASLNYYVENGRVSRMEMNVEMKMNGIKDEFIKTVTFSEFGTTVVERPNLLA